MPFTLRFGGRRHHTFWCILRLNVPYVWNITHNQVEYAKTGILAISLSTKLPSTCWLRRDLVVCLQNHKITGVTWSLRVYNISKTVSRFCELKRSVQNDSDHKTETYRSIHELIPNGHTCAVSLRYRIVTRLLVQRVACLEFRLYDKDVFTLWSFWCS